MMSITNTISAYFVILISKLIILLQIIITKIGELFGFLGSRMARVNSKIKERTRSKRNKFSGLIMNNKKYSIPIIILSILLILVLLTLFTRINYVQQLSLMIVTASNLILVSVGLTLTTRVRKFSNFAHAEFAIIGIYTAIAIKNAAAEAGHVNPWYQWIYFEIPLAFVLAGIVGILSEFLVFGPLTRRNASSFSLMVSSIGIGMIIRQTVQEIFSAIPKTASPHYPGFFDTIGEIPIIGILFRDRSTYWIGTRDVLISRDEVWAVITMILTVLALRYLFTRTTLGMSMRATSDDAELAQISGINTQFVIYSTWFIAAGVTGMGALFLFEASQIQPGSGFVQLLLIFAVVTLGGFDSFEGTLISGFIISFSMTAATMLNSSIGRLERSSDSEFIDAIVFWNTGGDWKLVAPFAIIVVVLLFRPRGIFGVVDPRSKL